jgi:exonuclease VII small subunit
VPLEESIAMFEEAVRLAKMCYERLDKAEKRVTKLVGKREGGFVLEPFEESTED